MAVRSRNLKTRPWRSGNAVEASTPHGRVVLTWGSWYAHAAKRHAAAEALRREERRYVFLADYPFDLVENVILRLIREVLERPEKILHELNQDDSLHGEARKRLLFVRRYSPPLVELENQTVVVVVDEQNLQVVTAYPSIQPKLRA